MPKLYAYNTSATQVKKRYAMIGSTATPIKKKYAMIGSTATLVYSAEENILSKFSASDYYNPNGAYQAASVNSDGSLQFNSTSYIFRNIWTPAVDLSQWSTLTVTYTVTESTQSSGVNPVRIFYVMANSSNNFSADWNHRTDMYGDNVSGPGTSYYKMYLSGYADYYGQSYYVEPNLDKGKTYTQTIDISSWTGSQKIGLCALCGDSNTLTMRVTSVKLS